MTATFEYTARNIEGKPITGKIDGQNEREAIEKLGAKGLLVVSFKLVEAGKGAAAVKIGRIPMHRLAAFTRQMATMIRAGMPIMQSLEALGRQSSHPAMKLLILDVTSAVAQGLALSEALARHPKIFSKLYVCMVQAGESSGTICELLERLAVYLESTVRLRKKVRTAMTYPVIVSVMAIGITIFLVTCIIPVFGDIYKEFGHSLPAPTRILINVSELVRHNLLGFLIGGALLVYGAVKLRRTEKGSWLWDKYKMKAPLFGPLAQNIALARFSRTMGTLLRSGVAILNSCDIGGKSAGNILFEAASIQMGQHIKSGMTFTDALRKYAIFPPLMQEMVNAGEQTGAVPEMLEQVANYYDQEVENSLSSLTSMIEPLLIAFLGIVLGSVVVAMFLPIFNISQIVQF